MLQRAADLGNDSALFQTKSYRFLKISVEWRRLNVCTTNRFYDMCEKKNSLAGWKKRETSSWKLLLSHWRLPEVLCHLTRRRHLTPPRGKKTQ